MFESPHSVIQDQLYTAVPSLYMSEYALSFRVHNMLQCLHFASILSSYVVEDG